MLGGKSAGQANETFIDENGTTRNIFYAQGDEFKNSQIGKANAKNDIVTADLYEEAGKDKSLTALQQTPRNAPNDALPEETGESSYVTWMKNCNATGGNCTAYAYDQFAQQEQAKSDVRATLSELENTASTTKKSCDANDEACKVKAELNAYNQRLAGELKSMGATASTAAEFLSLPYGIYTTVDSITKFVEQNGDSVVQLITENPTAAAAAGVTAVCAATPSCRAGLKNWIDPPASSPSVVTKVDEVPKGGVTKADVDGEMVGQPGDTQAISPINLQLHEDANGHLLEKHVSKSSEELIARANGQNGVRAPMGGASSYSSLGAAEFYTNEILMHKADEIEQYLLNPNAPTKAFDLEFNQGTGVWVPKNGTETQVVTAARVVIKPDASMPNGYRIVTGHPIPSSAIRN